MAKDFITQVHIPNKQYSYELDGIQLNFTLRQDVKKDMISFKKLCEQAMKDIDVDLEKVPAANPKK